MKKKHTRTPAHWRRWNNTGEKINRREVKAWAKRLLVGREHRDELALRALRKNAKYGNQYWLCPLGHIWMLLCTHNVDPDRADDIRWGLHSRLKSAGYA